MVNYHRAETIGQIYRIELGSGCDRTIVPCLHRGSMSSRGTRKVVLCTIVFTSRAEAVPNAFLRRALTFSSIRRLAILPSQFLSRTATSRLIRAVASPNKLVVAKERTYQSILLTPFTLAFVAFSSIILLPLERPLATSLVFSFGYYFLVALFVATTRARGNNGSVGVTVVQYITTSILCYRRSDEGNYCCLWAKLHIVVC